MLLFTKKVLKELKEKLKVTRRYSKYFFKMAADNAIEISENMDKYLETEIKTVKVPVSPRELIGTGKMEFRELKIEGKTVRYLASTHESIDIESMKNGFPPVTKFLKKQERMKNCMSLMVWNKYEQSKVLDLQRVNRCTDRFCPNCRSVALSQAIVKFQKPYKDMLAKGYKPYLLTLTIKNVHGDDLKETIAKMQKGFRKFFQWLSLENAGEKDKGFKKRIFTMTAAMRSLEITIEKGRNGYYHPHFHAMVFLTGDENLEDFEKNIPDVVRKKTGKMSYISQADIFISKLWTFAFNGTRINHWDKLPDEIIYSRNEQGQKERNYYVCDIRPMHEDGIYEVFKYCFKDSDIKNYWQFKTIYEALNGRRIRQGHGELYNYDFECDKEAEVIDEGNKIESHLKDADEKPEQIVVYSVDELINDYEEYTKISRYNFTEHMQKVESMSKNHKKESS